MCEKCLEKVAIARLLHAFTGNEEASEEMAKESADSQFASIERIDVKDLPLVGKLTVLGQLQEMDFRWVSEEDLSKESLGILDGLLDAKFLLLNQEEKTVCMELMERRDLEQAPGTVLAKIHINAEIGFIHFDDDFESDDEEEEMIINGKRYVRRD